MSKTSDMIREKFGKTDQKRDEGLQTPKNIFRYDNILYGQDENFQSLDLYKPKEQKTNKLPVIISVHGGGWVYGDKEKYQYYCINLAQRGFAVINFSYRLAPENKFPAALEDTCLVFHWIIENALNYQLDTKNLFAVGDSAGANILALACAMCTNEDYRQEFTFAPPSGFKLKAIALNCGVNVIEQSDEDTFSKNLIEDYLKNTEDCHELYLVNALNHMNEQFPPTFLMSAKDDYLKFQMTPVIHKLLEKNIPFKVRYYCDDQEKLGHVFHLNIRSSAAKICNDEECNFFKFYKK